ncbi:hypothetical protein V8F20_012307, partial [Naviculisporaceae sp. PSN 640]
KSKVVITIKKSYINNCHVAGSNVEESSQLLAYFFWKPLHKSTTPRGSYSDTYKEIGVVNTIKEENLRFNEKRRVHITQKIIYVFLYLVRRCKKKQYDVTEGFGNHYTNPPRIGLISTIARRYALSIPLYNRFPEVRSGCLLLSSLPRPALAIDAILSIPYGAWGLKYKVYRDLKAIKKGYKTYILYKKNRFLKTNLVYKRTANYIYSFQGGSNGSP